MPAHFPVKPSGIEAVTAHVRLLNICQKSRRVQLRHFSTYKPDRVAFRGVFDVPDWLLRSCDAS